MESRNSSTRRGQPRRQGAGCVIAATLIGILVCVAGAALMVLRRVAADASPAGSSASNGGDDTIIAPRTRLGGAAVEPAHVNAPPGLAAGGRDMRERAGDARPADKPATQPCPQPVVQPYDFSTMEKSIAGLAERVDALHSHGGESAVSTHLRSVQTGLREVGDAVRALADLPTRMREACQVGAMEAFKSAADAVPAAPALPAAAADTAPRASPNIRSAIVGMAKAIPVPNFYRFVRSARERVGWDVDLIIFMDAATRSADMSRIIESFRVHVQDFDAARLPGKQAGFHPSSYRWILMRDWMKALAPEQRYDHLLFIDVRDTVFQADPFAHVQGQQGFWAFLESKPGTIAQCGWNSGWVKDCFGQAALDRVGNEIISCSGSSIASWADAMAYVDMMAEEIIANPCERNGVDQGMHQWFLYGGLLAPKVSKLNMITNEEGWIATVQSMPSLQRDVMGRVLNARGEVVAIVHQYDRSSALKEQYDREFVWLPEHELRRK